MVKILLSGNPDLLEDELKKSVDDGFESITVEAEYGDRVVEGSSLTLAHHGLRKHNPCPCLFTNNGIIDVCQKDYVIGISHIDLDTMCAIVSIINGSPRNAESFLNLVAFIDLHGFHKLSDYGASEIDLKKQYACSAYIQKHRPQFSNEIKDVTPEVIDISVFMSKAIDGNLECLEVGEEYKKTLDNLNEKSFIDKIGDVIVRVSPDFVNHLYTTPTGEGGIAMVTFNPSMGSITVSFADPILGLSCREIVQSLWGKDAGGHDGIAGSPRGQRMKFVDLENAVHFVSDFLRVQIIS